MRLDVGERLGVTILDRRGRVPGRSSGRRVTHPRRASSWVAPSPTKFLSALSRLWRKDGATGREGAQKSWTGRSPSSPADPGRPVNRSEKATSLRSRAVGPSDDELTDDGDVCPQVSGPAHANPLSRVRDDPRRATRLALPTEPFSPSRLNVGRSRSPPRPSVPRTGWLPASVSAPRRPRARVSPLRAPALWSSARRSPPPRPSWSSAKVRPAPAPR